MRGKRLGTCQTTTIYYTFYTKCNRCNKMEYVTIKVPRKAIHLIREQQAEQTLEEGRKVTQGEVVLEALEERKINKPALPPRETQKSNTFWDIYGSIKGKGKKINHTKMIDEVVYGGVQHT